MQSYNYRFDYTQRHRLVTDDEILSYIGIRIMHHGYVHNIIHEATAMVVHAPFFRLWRRGGFFARGL